MNFEDLIAKVKTCGKQKLAVAAAEDDAVLEAVDAAHKQGIADAILVGDETAIRKIAAELNIDLSDYEIINEPDKVQASLKAVKLAHDGVANMYMKGLLDTKTFLKSVLDKEVGLRTGNTLSHVAVFEVKGIEQLLFLTDVAFMTYPTLEDKVHIIENTVAVAHACGVECPKVAPLAAVEVVNPKMPCTVDADELRKMNAEGKITGCVVDGPLSMDIAIDPEAAHHKGAQDRPAAELKETAKQLEILKAQMAAAKIDGLFENAADIDGVRIVSAYLTGTGADTLRDMVDKVRDKAPNAVTVLIGSDGNKTMMAVGVSKNAMARGLKAGALVKKIAAIAGGNGGGKPDFAMAGIRDTSKIDDALNAVPEIVKAEMNQ